MSDTMTDTNPTCEVCGAEMVNEEKSRCAWTVTKSSVRGPPAEEERTGWNIEREFQCGATSTYSAYHDGTTSWAGCPHAYAMVMKLKRRVAELEGEMTIVNGNAIQNG